MFCRACRKRHDLWEVLCHGDSMSEEWQQHIQKMPPEIKKAHDKWNKAIFKTPVEAERILE